MTLRRFALLALFLAPMPDPQFYIFRTTQQLGTQPPSTQPLNSGALALSEMFHCFAGCCIREFRCIFTHDKDIELVTNSWDLHAKLFAD